MEPHAEDLVRKLCLSMGENLDQPIIHYLARLSMDSVEGTMSTEVLMEEIQPYLVKTLSLEAVEQLQEYIRKPPTQIQKTEAGRTSSLNAEAPAFEPRSNREESDEGCPFDGSRDPLEVLWSIFPGKDKTEIERVYLAYDGNVDWTLDKLLRMKEGCEGGYLEDCHLPIEEEFPALPGNQSAVSTRTGEKKVSFLDVAKKKKPPTRERQDSGSLQRRPSNEKLKSKSDGSIPWVVTGEAVAKQYAELREAASKYARLRNACFWNATKAYREGKKGLAKELGQEGRMYNNKMKDCHYEASEAIFRSRNQQLRRMLSIDSPEVMDLHGLHVAEAERILSRELGNRRTKKQKKLCSIHLLVGNGHHTKGAKTPSRLPRAVKSFLTREGYDWKDGQAGVVEVNL